MPNSGERPSNPRTPGARTGRGSARQRAPSAVFEPTLDWDTEAPTWPHAGHCRFVTAAGLRWFVLEMGQGPAVLLVHGLGASSHSWRALAPLLARRHRVVAFDLPGHGFTSQASPRQRSLPGMAQAVSSLLAELEVAPAVVVGHSAGAAILARLVLDGGALPRAIVSLNGAFVGFRGPATRFFSPIAKLLFLNPLVPAAFAWTAGDPLVARRLLAETGSRIDAEGLALYSRLFANARHVAGALGMMAAWDLDPLRRDLRRLQVPLHLVAGLRDRMVPPEQAEEIRRLVPVSDVTRLPGLGHLAHEEDPATVARTILQQTRARGSPDEA